MNANSYHPKISIPHCLLFVLLHLCVSVTAVNAFEQVRGTIDSNTRWTRERGPYIVVGNVVIPEGITLTIEPGVRVQFDGARWMRVHGALVAEGTPDARIVFTANVQPSFGEVWGGVRFSETGGSVFDDAKSQRIDGSILKHVAFEFANPAIDVIRTGLVIENCLFEKNLACIRLHDTRHAFLRNNVFRDNAGMAIELLASAATDPLELYDTRITGNEFRGSFISLSHPRLTYLEFGRNRVVGTEARVLIGGLVPFDVRTVHAHHNAFVDNATALVLDVSTTNSSDPAVRHVLVENNVFTGTTQFAITGSVETNAHTQLSNNTFVKCSIGMRIVDARRVTIRGNTFVHNRSSITYEYYYDDEPTAIVDNIVAYNSYEALGLRVHPRITLRGNDFLQNDGFVLGNYSMSPVDARQNFWGAGSTQDHVSQWIKDSSDGGYGPVMFIPMNENGTFTAPIVPPRWATVRAIDGGVVLRWPASPDPRTSGYRIWFDRDSDGRLVSWRDFADTGGVIFGRSSSEEFAITAFMQGARGENDQLEGRESWPFLVTETTTSAVDDESFIRASAMSVRPNPTSGSVQILMDLNRSATVYAAVYDAYGSRVRTIPSVNAAIGATTLEWDGLDDTRSPVANGMYWVRAVVGRETHSHAVIIAR